MKKQQHGRPQALSPRVGTLVLGSILIYVWSMVTHVYIIYNDNMNSIAHVNIKRV